MGRTTRTPFVGSLGVHILALLALIAVRDRNEAQQAADAAPRTSARLVFLHQPGPGGGGGGGGERDPEPPRRADVPGRDRTSAPVAPPPNLSFQPAAPIVEVVAPVLSAVPTAAATALSPGVIDQQAPRLGSQGSGTDDGAGIGAGRGAGPGDGAGLGPGSSRGFGDRPYEVGNGVTAPVPVRQIRPSYTTAAMSARLAGLVLIECVVMPDGSVANARITRSLDPRLGLDEEAVKAARQWRFRPGTLRGEPVAVRVTIELSFSIY